MPCEDCLVSPVADVGLDVSGSIDSRDTVAFTCDANNFRLSAVSESDTDNNGIVDSIISRTYTNDARGNRLSEARETDADNNGSIDNMAFIASAYTRICCDNLADFDPWGDLTAEVQDKMRV